MTRLHIELRFHLATALHVTGNTPRPGADKAMALSVDRHPVIPATTVKGFLRERAEIALRVLGLMTCLGPGPEGLCDPADACVVCRVFGNPRLDAALRISDATCLRPAEPTAIRSGVAISRHRRAAYPQRLFFLETTSSRASVWKAVVEGHFADEMSAREAAALVDLACRWGGAIGGGKTRGLGWIDGIELTATVGDNTISREELVTIWRSWKG